MERDELALRAKLRTWEVELRALEGAREPEARERAAKLLFDMGQEWRWMEEPDAARERYTEVVRRYGDDSEPGVSRRVGEALLALADTWVRQGEVERAREFFARLVLRHGEAEEPSLRVQAAEALAQWGQALVGQARTREARERYAEVVHRFGASGEPALRKQVARARLWGWTLLRGEGRGEEARDGFTEALRGLGGGDRDWHAELLETVNRTALEFNTAKYVEEALLCLDVAVANLVEDAPRDVHFETVVALSSRAQLLKARGRTEEALADAWELVRRGRAVGGPGTDQLVMAMQYTIGGWLEELERLDEARACYEECRRLTLERTDAWETDTPGILLSLGGVAERQGDPEAALGAYAESVRRFDTALGLPRDRTVTLAHQRLGRLQCELGRFDEARATFQDMMRRYGRAPEEWLREQAVLAHFHLGVVLRAEGREEEAVASLQALCQHQGASENPEVRRLLCLTLFQLGELSTSLGRAREARVHFTELLRRAASGGQDGLEERLAAARRALATLE